MTLHSAMIDFPKTGDFYNITRPAVVVKVVVTEFYVLGAGYKPLLYSVLRP